MRAGIAAGLASIVGIVGVMGLTRVTIDSGPASPPPAVAPATATAGPGRALAVRLARVRRVERAADAALRQVAARSAQATAARPIEISTAARPLVRPAIIRRDDVGEDRGGAGGRREADDR